MFHYSFQYLWIIVQVVVGYNLILPVVLFLCYRLVMLLRKEPPASHLLHEEKDYAIIVTAYGQTHTLPPVIDSLLQLRYTNYLIYIVADNCDVSQLSFNSNKVVLLRPDEVLSSNTRSHFYAIEHFKRPHTHLTIIDSDNLADPEYLNELNVYFNQGYQAVQGTRAAKNLDTTYACLDAARDLYYHFFDGEILFSLGSSATLSGSGMAFTVSLYKQCLGRLDVTGAGFDKVLQYELVKRGHRIAFAKNAIVYDEKTSRSEQLVKQRARWINTWFRYFTFSFRLLGNGMVSGSFNKFLFGIILLRPPLFMFLLLSVFCLLLNVVISPLSSLLWMCALFLFVVGFFIAIKQGNADKRIYQSLSGIWQFMLLQVKSLLKAKSANAYSVATQHYYVKKIDEV